jgi:hypothetical protein
MRKPKTTKPFLTGIKILGVLQLIYILDKELKASDKECHEKAKTMTLSHNKCISGYCF